MTDKKPILFKDAYPLCWKANLVGTCASEDIEQALKVARGQGKLAGKKEKHTALEETMGYLIGFDRGQEVLVGEFLDAVERECMDGDEMLVWMKERLKSQLKEGGKHV